MEFPPDLLFALQTSRAICVLSGAGISAESGVPTFRDAQTGLWAQYAPEELATPQAFQRNPRLVWEWYQWRRKLVGQAAPNPAHLALVEMEKRVPSFTLLTQNVDGLHQQAGSQAVIELHGNIWRNKCFSEGRLVEAWEETDESPPRCPHCGSYIRPDVVWFGEPLPQLALERAWQAAQSCDLFFSIGTSGLVQPAASLPYTALEQGACLVEINPAITPLTSQVAFFLQGPAGQVLPELVSRAWS